MHKSCGIKKIDLIFLTTLTLLGSVLIVKKLFFSQKKKNHVANEEVSKIIQTRENHSTSVNPDNFNVLIYYASQSGSSQRFSNRLAKILSIYESLTSCVINLTDYEEKYLLEMKSSKRSIVLFIVSTYGEGEPPESARKFYERFQTLQDKRHFSGVFYSVLALGNSIYPKYNTFGKFIHKKMKALGATPLAKLHLADAHYDQEKDYLEWSLELKRILAANYKLISNMECVTYDPKYEVVYSDTKATDQIFSGEISLVNSFVDQRPPFNSDNPFMATIIKKRELTKSSDRSILHLEVDIYGSGLKFEPGDYCGVYCKNDAGRVSALAQIMAVDFSRVIHLNCLDYHTKPLFPTPCTIQTAFSCYLDLKRINNPIIFLALSKYTTDSRERSHLLELSSDDLVGKELRNEYITKASRDIVDVLEELTTCRPPVDILVQILPRLDYRYYSISSKPDNKPLPSTLHITAAVVQFVNSKNRNITGTCTGMFSRLSPGSQLPLFITRSQFHLPKDPTIPLILVGPGTGFAPLRSFLQKRHELLKNGEQLGLCALFFGCRHEDSEFIYQAEMSKYLEIGVISHLYTAFSRDPPKNAFDRELISMTVSRKIYVQHRMAQASNIIWQVISSKGYIFVSGDASSMAKDVEKTLVQIIADRFSKSKEQAVRYLERLKATGRYNIDVWG